MKYIYPPTLLCDFYKVSHREQYPKGTEKIYSTWTARTSRIKGVDSVIFFGLQAFIKKYLIEYFDENFFSRSLIDIVKEYKRVIKGTLGIEDPDTSHIEALHTLGYLPLLIKALPEGTKVPIKCPMLTVENTAPEFYWVTNYIETLLSCSLWQPITSATIANRYKNLLTDYAKTTGGDLNFVQFQGHDFSMRGMSSLETAKSSGGAHLLSFVGTDTIPGILFLEEFYNADIEKELIGTSIPATEHSVMCAYGKDELTSYKKLITEVYPKGFVSIVSDTWNLWDVLENVIAKLKPEIMAREGKVVIRPDSGDPVKIICGDPNGKTEAERKGVMEILWDIFGGTINDAGFKVLDPHIGCIYGDAITLERCNDICMGLFIKGIASTNMVYGIGSYTYQYNTRDTFSLTFKSTYAKINGEEQFLQKDPITDRGIKKSQSGMVVVIRNDEGKIIPIDSLNEESRDIDPDYDLLENVFKDGKLLRNETLAQIRSRL